jgi:hypothetical protein
VENLDNIHCLVILACLSPMSVLKWQALNTLLGVDETGNILYWRQSKITPNTWYLHQLRFRSYPLTCQQMNLMGCIGLSHANHRLLQQFGAVGEPSCQPPARIRDARTRAAVPGLDYPGAIFPVSAPPTSLLTQGRLINYEQWVVHLVRKPESRDPYHVFILLEGINAYGKAFFLRYELVTTGVARGFARICRKDNLAQTEHTSELDESARERLLEAFIGQSQKVALSWVLERKQGLQLINTIEGDMGKDIAYSSRGGSALRLRFHAEAEVRHNCFTWAREKLQQLSHERIRRDLANKPFDSVIANPAWYVVVEGAQSRHATSRCLVM